jgi:transcriptional regulator with XRE-family HTH domain
MPQRPRRLDPEASPLARFGARLRDYRVQQGWAQAELGRLAHVSGTLIAKMERAERRPQPAVARSLDALLDADGELARLAAAALRAQALERRPAQLKPDPDPLGQLTGRGAGWARGVTELRRLADIYDQPEDGDVRTIVDLRTSVHDLIGWRLNSEYTHLVRVLPQLIPELTRALDSGEEHERVARYLVQAWRAADAVAAKLGLIDLSARLIHVMGWAAAQSGENGLALAATSYVRAETFFVSGQMQAGHLMLERAAARVPVDTSGPAGAAQYGALHMRAAIAAARAGLNEQARDHLTEARSMAELVPEGTWEGTAFGPESVRIHEVSTAVEMDAPQDALAAAGIWEPPDSLPAERRSHYFVDVARAYLAVRQYEDAFEALQKARRIAPENVSVDPRVRETLAEFAAGSAANAVAALSFARKAEMSGCGAPSPTAITAGEAPNRLGG